MRSETGENLQVPGRGPATKSAQAACLSDRELTQTCGHAQQESYEAHDIHSGHDMACTCATRRRVAAGFALPTHDGVALSLKLEHKD